MYEPFFGLDSSPFGLTPDPRFLFRSKGHHDILSSLLYGVTTGKGVMLLLGDVGTGKTTLCRALLRELPPEAESVLLLNPHLSETELVGAILDDLGVERRGLTRGELMAVLNAYLLTAGGEGKVVARRRWSSSVCCPRSRRRAASSCRSFSPVSQSWRRSWRGRSCASSTSASPSAAASRPLPSARPLATSSIACAPPASGAACRSRRPPPRVSTDTAAACRG
jgi:energy-coupling factor transporter ATP-binding protein EcfA2